MCSFLITLHHICMKYACRHGKKAVELESVILEYGSKDEDEENRFCVVRVYMSPPLTNLPPPPPYSRGSWALRLAVSLLPCQPLKEILTSWLLPGLQSHPGMVTARLPACHRHTVENLWKGWSLLKPLHKRLNLWDACISGFI